MVDRNDSFIQEVDEELRREQVRQIWDRYGIVIVILFVLALIGVGGYKYMESRNLAARQAASVKFEQALRLVDDSKSDEALKAFQAIAKDAPAAYQTLSRLQIATVHEKAGRNAEALAVLDAIAKETDVDPLARDLAVLKAAMLRLDSMPWSDLEAQIGPLAADTAPFRALAREALGLGAYKAGKTAEAQKYFGQIIGDPSVPVSLQQRAQVMLSLLTDTEAAKAGDKKTSGGDTPAAASGDAKPGNAGAPEPKKN